MVVDISSTISSLSQEMVDALDLGNYQGSEVELSLPNDLRTQVPQLLLPQIALGDEKALFVKGVVLKESVTGTDGSLGLSFLNRFDYTIEGSNPPRLILRPYERSSKDFDVFICHHRDDIELARAVHRVLHEAGRKPFLSELLPRSSAQELYKAMDDALAGAAHMVVVCSDAQHVRTPWMEAEWRLFDRRKRAGEKQGNLVTVIAGDTTVSDLPDPLNAHGIVKADDADWASTLVESVKP
jgi:hypothetical protein